MRKTRWLLAAVSALLCLGLAYWITPGISSPRLPSVSDGGGEVRVCINEDGSVSLAWPPAGDAAYLLSVLPEGGRWSEAESLAEPFAVLEEIPFQVSIQPVRSGKNLLGMTRSLKGQKLTVAVPGVRPGSPRLTASPEAGVLSLSWSCGGDVYDIYEVCSLEEGGSTPLASLPASSLELRFGPGGDLEIPSYGHPLQIAVRAGVQGDGCVCYGPLSDSCTVKRESLLGDTLSLSWEETEPRLFVLRWQETRGDYYEVQRWENGDWQAMARLEPAETFLYETGRLGSGTRHRLRVAAFNADGTMRSSEEAELCASISTLYATVWPISDLEFYETPGASGALKKIPAGTALCVLEETGDWFRVRYLNDYGYVDSRFCMINLAEYLGDCCAYDITNSYSSVFQVHGSPIARVTQQVIPGFEHIRTEAGFLVPYLYPCARKLLTAARAAMADGYRLRIYEAFRPNQATRFLYDTTAGQLNLPALTEDDEGEFVDPQFSWRVELSTGLLIDPVTGDRVERASLLAPEEEESPLPEDGSGEEGAEADMLPDEAGLPEEDEPDEVYDTYGKIMTNNGAFRLGSFLAASASTHNQGIALDLTLETLDTGRELSMQSAIHDLSWYSAAYLNNDNARLLESYMTGAGMGGLSSEWWHFQDNETRDAIGLTSVLYKGVDAGGWTRDDTGWRYRNADGSCLRNTAVTVGGVRWALDGDGYVKE